MDQQIEKVVWTYINDRLKPIIADTLNETMPRLLKEHNRDLIPARRSSKTMASPTANSTTSSKPES